MSQSLLHSPSLSSFHAASAFLPDFGSSPRSNQIWRLPGSYHRKRSLRIGGTESRHPPFSTPLWPKKSFPASSYGQRSGGGGHEDAGETSDRPLKRSSPGAEYEVFLSFRGPNTRKGFVDCLYHSLVDAGVRTFRDNDELNVGETISDELVQAINKSKICIPIFSKDYADSVWCLRELAHMIECRKSTEVEILPIFYDVELGEVKLHKGPYIRALHVHRKRYGANLLKQWEDALKEVGKIKGWELEKTTNG